jgi:uncharacterized protein YebE (UPF0316 family)
MPVLDLIFGGPWGPLVIFFLRVVDVSLAILRTLLAMRGARLAVPVLGFFESMIWVLAVGSAIQNLDSPLHILGYAGGFAAGNSVGMWLEGKLAVGLATIRIISRYGGVELADALRDLGFGVTEFSGKGRHGTVEVVFTVVRRRQIPHVLKEVERWDPDAFISVEEPRSIRRGWMFDRRRK